MSPSFFKRAALVGALILTAPLAQAQQLTPRLTPRLAPRPTTPKPKASPQPAGERAQPQAPPASEPPPSSPPKPSPAPAKPPPASPGPLVPRLVPRPTPTPAPAASAPNTPTPSPAAPPRNGTRATPVAPNETLEEIEDEQAQRKKEKSRGVYVAMGAGLTFGLRSTHEWNEDCPKIDDPELAQFAWSPSCEAKAPLGPALEGRLGYRFGTVGLEAFGIGAADWSTARLSDTPESIPASAFAKDMLVGRLGFGGGLGLRFSGEGFARPSAAIGVGGMYRHVFTSLSSLDGSSVNYGAPIIKSDLTFTLGGLVNIGIMGWVEFSRRVSVKPNVNAIGDLSGIDLSEIEGLDLDRIDLSQLDLEDDTVLAIAAFEQAVGDVTIFNGPQYFIGPYIGLHLGK